MSHVIFDTLAFVKKLKQSGFDETQAEALSDAFKEAQKTAIDDLVTKADFQELKHEILLIKWMIGFVLASIFSIAIKILTS